MPVEIEQKLLDDQPAKAVANKYNRAVRKGWRTQENFEKVNSAVLQRHGCAEPIGRGRLISERINREPLDVLGQPDWPE